MDRTKINKYIAYFLRFNQNFQDAEDFASYCIEHNDLRDRSATNAQLLADYLRYTKGRKDTRYFEGRRSINTATEYNDEVNYMDIRNDHNLRHFDDLVNGEERIIWLLYTLYGLTYNEIANILEYNQVTVIEKMKRIIKRLKAINGSSAKW